MALWITKVTLVGPGAWVSHKSYATNRHSSARVKMLTIAVVLFAQQLL